MPKVVDKKVVKPSVGKSVKLRPKRFATFLCRGVTIVFEAQKDKNGKIERTPDGKGTVGKPVTLRQDMWSDPKAFKEVVDKFIANDYANIIF